MGDHDVLLTGLPRSGTTLACRLLNQLPDTVALVEPMKPRSLAGLPRSSTPDAIEEFARRQRRSLRSSGAAISRHVDGSVTDNLFAAARTSDGLRPFVASHGELEFGQPIDPDFTLVIKHPALFAALLPELVPRFHCVAVIRNPLAVLASWNSTDMAVRNGHAPAAERHDRELEQTLASIDGRFERQIALLSWYVNQFRQHLPDDRIVRYEDLVGSRGRALTAVTPSAEQLDEPLTEANRNPLYDTAAITEIADRLLAADGAHWDFYSADDIRRLIESPG